MIECEIKVTPSFEVSSAAQLVQTASQFKSYISLVLGEKTANAKSIMGIISLSLSDGDLAKIVVSGEDEDKVVPEIKKILGED